MDGEGAAREVRWDALPEAVVARLAELASGAVATMRVSDVPQPLRPLAKFAPGKRARLGRSAFVTALRESDFRTAVLEWCREHDPEALDIGAADPAAAAAASLLTDSAGATHLVELAARRSEDSQLRAERDSALARCERLGADNERLRAEIDSLRERVEDGRSGNEAELDKLRKRLREQGVRLKEARDAAQQAQTELERVREESEAAVREANAERDRERERRETERAKARKASTDAEAARQSAQEARRADEVRLGLLLETLSGAVTGLRQELSTGGGGPQPADTVRGASTHEGASRRAEDAATLDRLLALPGAHLVVDGYNVTKTGYPELPLSDQRERLVHQMATLAARTGAEVTVVFDGAGVVAVPATTPRGVRVLFSDPGVLADDVIRSLVAAEPQGRPLVVATSDRAVVDSVRERGAHPVASAVLLSRIARV